MSSVVMTPGGKGKAVSVPTTSVPAAVVVEIRPAEQHGDVVVVVLVVDAAVVLVVEAAVVLVVDAPVVLVVDGAVVLVVVLGGHGFGEHEPAPMLIPPAVVQSAAETSVQVSNAPIGEDCTQHWM